MACEGISAKLGHFVVDNFHPKTMTLKVDSGSINITPESIHHILGIPCGGTEILSLQYNYVDESLLSEWYAQYEGKDMRPNDIVHMIVESDDAGMLFKLNFLMLFLNTMGECIGSGKCKLTVMPYLHQGVDIQSLDWCGYIHYCLKVSKISWKREDPGCFYSGPLTVLTLQAVLKNIESIYTVVFDGKLQLESSLRDGLKKFPDNGELKSWKKKFEALFMNDAIDEPVVHEDVEADVAASDEADVDVEAAEKTGDGEELNDALALAFVAKSPKTIMKKKAQRREVVSEQLRSPYMKRKTDTKCDCSRTELKISSALFAMMENPM